jgi:hypothetical protein
LFLSASGDPGHEDKGVGPLFSYLLAGDFQRVGQSNQRWDMLCRIASSGHYFRWRPKKSACDPLDIA